MCVVELNLTLLSSNRKRGYVARLHDESYVNRFFAERPPDRVLAASYMYPILEYVHPWLFRAFPIFDATDTMMTTKRPVPVGSPPILPPSTCARLYGKSLPVVPESGWVWPCVDITPDDRCMTPLVWNLLKCGKKPCPSAQRTKHG
jgi:hypothetical protein